MFPTEFTNGAREPWAKIASGNASPLRIDILVCGGLLICLPKFNESFPNDLGLLLVEFVLSPSARDQNLLSTHNGESAFSTQSAKPPLLSAKPFPVTIERTHGQECLELGIV
jgi:hypothetical protein